MRPTWIGRPGLLAKIGMVTLVPVLVMAFLLVRSLDGSARSGALERAQHEGIVTARLLGVENLRAGLTGTLSASERRELARGFRLVVSDGEVSGASLINLKGRIVQAVDPKLVGSRPRSPLLAAALQGKSGVGELGDAVDVYSAVVAPGGEPLGALRVRMPSGAIDATVADQTGPVYLILGLGLGALCLGLGLVLRDARRRMAEEASRKERQALSDALTGLPNRTLFNELLEKALAECPRNKRVGVLLMDLDRFKEINDSLGHFNGDRVIERVGERLNIIVREGDTVARLGGDEFAMLLPNISDAEAATVAAQRVHKTLEEPFTAGGLALRVEASIGIALYPDHGDKAGKLMRAADVAMYASKKGHSGHAIYSPDQQHYSPARLGLVAQLDRAMAQGELVLHYQPKARFDNGAVEGAEALVRWQHPERGLLLPAEFIPVTEHTSMIRPVTIYLLEQALEQGMVWRRNGIDLRLAVNLSPQILLDLELPREIQQMLSRVGAPAESLELEVTESAIIYDPRRAQIVLEGLSAMGLRIAIDDFGTGYSSLVSLKNLPVSTIKIDKSFVMAMNEDNNDAAIVKSTVQLGRNLGLEVVAEGVETPNAWTRLAEMGCDLAQGYYLSRPLDGARFMSWLGAYEENVLRRRAAAAAAGPDRWGKSRPATAAHRGR
ncbi:MAG: EAL domain-containing protein [Actinomycetota bacterium]